MKIDFEICEIVNLIDIHGLNFEFECLLISLKELREEFENAEDFSKNCIFDKELDLFISIHKNHSIYLSIFKQRIVDIIFQN